MQSYAIPVSVSLLLLSVSYGVERFGVQDRKRVERVHLVKSRRQREMDKLVKERRNVRKQWKRITEEERAYKSALDILKVLWRQLRIVLEKQCIPRTWHRAGGVLIPKEKESSDLSQFRMISLLNVEEKILFTVVAQRLASYLEKNSWIDTTVQKAGIPGFAGCLEHSSMIWH